MARKANRKLEALYAEVYANPRDDGPRSVLADALIENGDARGEFIALQLRGDPATALVRKHGKAWMEPLANSIRTARLDDPRGKATFRRGFLAVATVDGIHESPAWATVEEITFRTTKIAKSMSRARLFRNPPLDALTRGPSWEIEELEIKIHDLDMGNQLAESELLEHLTRLAVTGLCEWIPSAQFATQLKTIEIDSRVPREIGTLVASANAGELPALERLIAEELTITRAPGGEFTVGAIEFTTPANLRWLLPHVELTSLAVTGTISDDARASIIADARGAGIHTLDLAGTRIELAKPAKTTKATKSPKRKQRKIADLETVTKLAYEGDALFVGVARGVLVLDAKTFEQRALWPTEFRVEAIAANAKHVAGSAYGTLHIFDRKTGKRLHHGSHVASTICDVATDGTRFAIGSENSKVVVIDGKSNKADKPMNLHKSYVNAVAFSPDKTMLATAGLDDEILLVDLAKRRTVKRFAHDGVATDVVFAAGGTELVTASYDATVRRWSVDGTQLAIFTRTPPADEPGKGSQAIAVFANGTPVVAWDDGDITFHDAKTLAVTRRITVQPGLELEDIAIAPGEAALAVTFDTGLAVIDVASGAITRF